MAIADFFKNLGNSHACEELFNHRLLFDLKQAAAAAGYHLRNYYSDVDHDGFDVIIDDGDLLRKIQLKTVGKSTATGRLASEKWGPKGEVTTAALKKYADELPAIMQEVAGHASP